MADRDLVDHTLGQFILRELIGEGGYGAVYRGDQPALEREVVIKVLREERDSPDARERFMREARLAAQLRHPYAAQVYDFGAEDNGSLLWIAMEWVQGVSLADWLDKNGRMPPERFVPFFEDVCEVVHAAHDRGIVHRDLKPSNIMVIECGDRLTPKLLDLGIARGSWKRRSEIVPGADDTDAKVSEPADDDDTDRDTDGGRTDRLPVRPRRKGRMVRCWGSETRRRLTPPDATLGTSQYMAPEMFGGADGAGPEADVYALGVIAYQTLTGRPPFTADNTREYFELHRHEPMPPLGDDFPPALDRAIRGALHKHCQIRTHSALELADNLKKALRTSPREQLKTSAQQWFDDRRPKGLLWGADVLEHALRSVPQQTLSQLECSFVAESQRRIRRVRWAKRALAAGAVMAAIGVFLYRASMHAELAQEQTKLAQEQTRAAQQVTEATIRQSELEQGRSALLYNAPDAAIHLARAYQRGDHSPSTEFMLARAMQPRLAEQARFASTFGRMWSAAYSPDGTQIVTTDDRNAQIWDARTRQLRLRLPHGAEVYQAVYTPDATRIVTVAEDAVRIWDATSGALVHKLARKTTDYFVVAISPNGRLVSAMNAAGSVAQVWDTATGAPLAELRNDGSEFPNLAFSRDGRWLATTGGTEAHVFNTQTWIRLLTIHGPGIRHLAFDPTSPHLLTGAATGDVSIWAIPDGALVHRLGEAREPVSAVTFSPDGRFVAAASHYGTERVWHAESGELQSELHPRHSTILAMEFDRTSQLVLTAGADGAVVVTDAARGLLVTTVEAPHKILAAHFDPSSRYVVGASWDGAARIWSATSPYRRWSSPPIADNCGISASAEPDRRFIAVGCGDRATHVWDTARDQLVTELPAVTSVEGDFNSAFPAVSSAGDRAAIARGNTVEVYELPGGRLLRTIAHGAAVNAVVFATTGGDIISGAVDGSLRVTRESGAQVLLPTATGGIDAVEFLPDGRVVAADARRRLRFYDAGGSVLADLELPGRVMSLRIEGTRLVTLPVAPPVTGNAGPPLLVDLERYRVITRLDGHVGQVFSARWIAGNQILTAGDDRTVRLWDGSKGQLRQIYRGSMSLLADATVTSDGLVVAGGADGLLRFWDKDSARQLWTFQAHTSLIAGVHVEGSDIVTRGFTGELSRWTLPSSKRVIGACEDHDLCGILDQ